MIKIIKHTPEYAEDYVEIIFGNKKGHQQFLTIPFFWKKKKLPELRNILKNTRIDNDIDYDWSEMTIEFFKEGKGQVKKIY